MISFHLDENGCVRGLFDGWMDGAREGQMNLAVVYSRCDPGGDSRMVQVVRTKGVKIKKKDEMFSGVKGDRCFDG